MGVGEVTEGARVGVPGEQPGEALDQVAEADRADPGARADKERQRNEQAFLATEFVP